MRTEVYESVALWIWDWAEVICQKTRSAKLFSAELAGESLDGASGVADTETALVAEYGAGSPVIRILAEQDALPGISQEALPRRQVRAEGGAGHACGHRLFGAACVAAPAAISDYLERTGSSGTIPVYGTPAEEGGAGKVYMVREGLFQDLDAVLDRHPSDRHDSSAASTLANRSAKFRFHGFS